MFKGSKRDFQKLLGEEYVEDDYTPFMELIRQYNAAIRANDVATTNDLAQFDQKEIENVVIYAESIKLTSSVNPSFFNFFLILSFISLAAALVKVIISNSFI